MYLPGILQIKFYEILLEMEEREAKRAQEKAAREERRRKIEADKQACESDNNQRLQ